MEQEECSFDKIDYTRGKKKNFVFSFAIPLVCTIFATLVKSEITHV